ncbi:MAG: beta-ketoacyl-ACP synthase III [Candidatus Electryonea clarkiae]|nr:beta-ketoacyl-ACP synthase III [Candidatus Electryonea clarkiae]MDP8287378.1 beta-ketoacyl-ACP synthase III [Candidatus Electryonea clarkiae]
MKSNGKPASRIAGMGWFAPDKILTNTDLERMVDTSDEWITTRTGIKRRHIVEPGTRASELATPAARSAMDEAGVNPEDIDMILVATVTGDYKFPSTAIFLQANLGAKNAVAMDISAACAGYLYTLHFADMMIRSGQAKTVLVVGVEVLTSMINWKDRSTCVLFGDAAGAAVVVPSADNRGILASYLGTDGSLADLLNCPGGGSAYPAMNREIPMEDFTIHMKGNEVFKHAVKKMGDAAVIALDLAGIEKNDIDLLFAHQANMRIIDATAKRLKVPQKKVFKNIQEYGNTSTASIPLAMGEARQKGLITDDSVVVCVAFGGGFTWASSVIRF